MPTPDDSVAFIVGNVLRPGAEPEVELQVRVTEQPFLTTVLRHAGDHRWVVLPLSSPGEAAKLLTATPTLGSRNAFVFLDSECFATEIAAHVRELCRLRAPHIRIVVYAKSNEDHGVLAVDCLAAGARDFIVRTLRARVVEARIVSALNDPEKDRGFFEIEPLRDHDFIFVVTPFGWREDRDYESCIRYGLRKLGFDVRRGDESRTVGSLLDKIHGNIKDARLVVANITRYNGRDNPNVFYEIGYARAKGKRVILLQKGGTPLPANLAGVECLHYLNRADLAGQLYRSLRHCAPNGSRHA